MIARIITDQERRIKDHLNVAINLRSEGKYLAALWYQRGYAHELKGCGPELQGKHHNGLGISHFNLGSFHEAIEEYRLAEKLFIEAEEPTLAATSAANIANSQIELDQIDDALLCLDRAEVVFEEAGATTWLAQIEETRARAYVRQGETRLAAKYAAQSFIRLVDGFEDAPLREAVATLQRALELLDAGVHTEATR